MKNNVTVIEKNESVCPGEQNGYGTHRLWTVDKKILNWTEVIWLKSLNLESIKEGYISFVITFFFFWNDVLTGFYFSQEL